MWKKQHRARRRRTGRGGRPTPSPNLTVEDAEKRLVLDWTTPLRHATFYKAVYRPAVLRANRLTPTAKLDPEQSFHSLRHTCASLCLAAGNRPIDIAALMGHRDAKVDADRLRPPDQH